MKINGLASVGYMLTDVKKVLMAGILFPLLAFSSITQAALLYGVQADNPNLVTVDSVTGQINTIGALPVPAPQVAGLTGWNNGTLLYTDGSNSGVYELNPANAALLNITPLNIGATGGLSYDTPSGSLFSVNNGAPIVSQAGLGGPLNLNFASINPNFPGAMGGDDNGRHFAVGGSSLGNGIIEFNPVTGALLNFLPSPAASLSGLAFDGQSLFASALTGNLLYTINPNSGAVLGTTSYNGPALIGLASLNPVPVPAAVWLFGTALVGLLGFSRRKKAA